MLDKTDPCSIEQSLMGFLQTLGILTKDLYSEKIYKLASEGRLRYTDYQRVEMLMQSIDGKYQFIVIKQGYGRYDRNVNPAERGSLLAMLLQIYPHRKLITKKEYTAFSNIYADLEEKDLKRYNLRQHKTTINLDAEELPLKIKKALGCRSSKKPYSY